MNHQKQLVNMWVWLRLASKYKKKKKKKKIQRRGKKNNYINSKEGKQKFKGEKIIQRK